ncbi:hypothetical protein N9294_01160 [bacterium]|nr:hypothetical protein [Akkermansiaceae bacterium]MDB4422553.1 hypothetical protein [bacterium]
MKKILLLASAVALPFLATSCADYATYGYGTVGAPIGGFGNPGFVGGGLAPLQVGFVATSFDRWAWDPYRRHYFDRSCGRYWDPRIRTYCAVAPRRFSAPIYPTGFRRGHRLACPTYLPRHTVVAGNRGHVRGPVRVTSNRGRYAPVIHGQSRGVASIRPSSYSGSNRSRETVSNRSYGSTRSSGYSTPARSSSSRSDSYRSSSYATPTRRSSSQSTQRSSGSSRYQTVSASPGRTRSTPVVRSSSYTPRSSSSSSYTPRSSPSRVSSSGSSSSRSTSTRSAPSRSTSSPSRSISQARQRTR